MAAKTLVATAVLALFLVGASGRLPLLSAGERDVNTVARVVDGDTLEVLSTSGARETVRLIGIDTPETKRPGTPVECGGREATDSMVRLAFRSGVDDDGDGLLDRGTGDGRRVALRTDSSQAQRDRYDRLLAYVTVRGGPMLNVEQIRRGWSRTYVFAGRPFALTDRFRRVERDARAAGRGAWGACAGGFHSPAG